LRAERAARAPRAAHVINLLLEAAALREARWRPFKVKGTASGQYIFLKM
jgi:hypothetical protein